MILYNLTESGMTASRSFQWIIFVAVAAALARPYPRVEAEPFATRPPSSQSP